MIQKRKFQESCSSEKKELTALGPLLVVMRIFGVSPFWKYCENSSVASSAATSASSSTMVSSNSLVFSSVLGTFSAKRFYFPIEIMWFTKELVNSVSV